MNVLTLKLQIRKLRYKLSWLYNAVLVVESISVLTCIDIQGVQITRKQNKLFLFFFFFTASLLPFLPKLQEISLSWNGCVGGTLKALTVHLHHVNLLKVLRLNNCRLTAEDVTSLGTGFIYIYFQTAWV